MYGFTENLAFYEKLLWSIINTGCLRYHLPLPCWIEFDTTFLTNFVKCYMTIVTLALVVCPICPPSVSSFVGPCCDQSFLAD